MEMISTDATIDGGGTGQDFQVGNSAHFVIDGDITKLHPIGLADEIRVASEGSDHERFVWKTGLASARH